ncbi:MAG: DNA polymerase III subunit chi [Maricaulaceae bacterium]|jgi:DNA polymerase-3 subunit chi
MDYWFYHLERTSLAEALPPLLEKARGKGWKAHVRSVSETRLAELDDALWTYRDESFLPHGRADQPGAARQPIVLSLDEERPNAAELIVLTDGVGLPTSSEGVERCVVMFAADDEEAVHAARQTWKSLKADGAALSYWRQTPDGGWREDTR